MLGLQWLADLLLDLYEQEFEELVRSGLDISTPDGIQHHTFELCSTADAKFLALLLRQLANNNTHFSLASPDITATSKTNPHLRIGDGPGEARPYTQQRRADLFMELSQALEQRRAALQAKGTNLEEVDWHAEAVALLRQLGHAQIGLPRNFGLILVDVLHLLLNCVRCGLRRYLRLLAWLSSEFSEPKAYFTAFAQMLKAINRSALGQLADRVLEKGANAELSMDGGAVAVLLREHSRWLASTLSLQQVDHTRQLHIVLLHLFRRVQHILQIACSADMTTAKLAQLKVLCAELQHGNALFLLSSDISPSMVRLAVELPFVADQLFNKHGVSIGLASTQPSERGNKECGQTFKRTNYQETTDKHCLHQAMEKLHVRKIECVRRKGFEDAPRVKKHQLTCHEVCAAPPSTWPSG
jgi:hypothetical protein